MNLTAAALDPGPACEALSAGPLAEPVSAVSSLAFVAAGAIVAARYLRPGVAPHPLPSSAAYPALVAGIGVGSFVQHGPNPAYADLIHDLPLAATLAFVAADSLAALSRRPRVWWWWAVPTLALVPLILTAPRPADLVQAGVAVVAVVLTLLRARAHPPVRRAVGWAVALLAAGALVDALSRSGARCHPESLWQGHAVWHVLAASALVVLAPVIGRRQSSAELPARPSLPK